MKVSVTYGKTITLPGYYGGDHIQVQLSDCEVLPGETIEKAVGRVGLAARACWINLMLRGLQDRMRMPAEPDQLNAWLVQEFQADRNDKELMQFLSKLVSENK